MKKTEINHIKNSQEIIYREKQAENIAPFSKLNDLIKSPSHYQLDVNGEKIDTKEILDAYVDEIKQSPSMSVWIFKVGKYYFRAFKKYDNPVQDLQKCVQCLGFILEKITGKKFKFELK